jgi:predicted lipoprotein with Yx(FWY)xxD motif
MKKVIVIAVIVVIIIAAGYIGFRMNTSSTQTAQQPTAPTSAMAVPSDNIYLIKTDVTKGKYLTDFAGMTLYVFDKDTTPNESSCYGACAKAWPFYTSGATAQKQLPAHIAMIVRTDGSKQFAWDGKPLYYYAGDAKPGDLTGDGIGGIWHIVKQ